jgi:acyl carrier protein phosphodiesterase
MVTTEEIAKELMKAISPKLEYLQNRIIDLDKRIDGLEGKIQTLNSVLMNQRKHRKG